MTHIITVITSYSIAANISTRITPNNAHSSCFKGERVKVENELTVEDYDRHEHGHYSVQVVNDSLRLYSAKVHTVPRTRTNTSPRSDASNSGDDGGWQTLVHAGENMRNSKDERVVCKLLF